MCVRACVCMCALGRPLECDSRPAQWQETPWRLWQAASCTPSFGFLSLTHFSSLCYSSISTYISSSPFLHLYSLHSYRTCLFVFLFHSSTLCSLRGSRLDLNNWTLLILYFFVYFFFSVSVNVWVFSFSLPLLIPFSFLSPSDCISSPRCDVTCPLSDESDLYNLAQRALISKSYLLSFTLLIVPSHHPMTSSTPQEGNYPSVENRAARGWGAPTSHAPNRACTHIYTPPRAKLRFNACAPLCCSAASSTAPAASLRTRSNCIRVSDMAVL